MTSTLRRTARPGGPVPRFAPWRLYAKLPGGLRGWVDRVGILRRLKHRTLGVRADRVLVLLDAMATADVETWLSGGWGVDALAGRQTRDHHDLDLVVRTEDTDSAVRCLTALGFSLYMERDVPEALLSKSLVFRDALGRHVDLHPAHIGREGTEAGPAAASLSGGALGTGSIRGRPVRCLTAAAQIELHGGYEPRERDLQDLAVLRGVLGSAPA